MGSVPTGFIFGHPSEDTRLVNIGLDVGGLGGHGKQFVRQSQMIWAVLTDALELRHNVNISAGMARYGWTAYDTREGGTQTIEDVQNKIDITTEFIKKSEGPSAGNWGLRIRGTPRKDAPADLTTSVVFYVGMESMDTCTKCKLVSSEQIGPEEDASIHAANFWIEHPQLGTAGMHIPASVHENKRHEMMVVKSMNVSDDQLWQARCKRAIRRHLAHMFRLNTFLTCEP